MFSMYIAKVSLETYFFSAIKNTRKTTDKTKIGRLRGAQNNFIYLVENHLLENTCHKAIPPHFSYFLVDIWLYGIPGYEPLDGLQLFSNGLRQEIRGE